MSAGGDCCLAFTPKVNEWKGRRKIEMQVVDLNPGIPCSGHKSRAKVGTARSISHHLRQAVYFFSVIFFFISSAHARQALGALS